MSRTPARWQRRYGAGTCRRIAEPWPAPRIEQLLRDVSSAFQEIHARQIDHRDVKPQNVLLADDGRAVLCDFGHALDPAWAVRLNKGRFGTMPYTAPEQRNDPDAVAPAADVYSLGAIGYLLSTGRRPAFDIEPLAGTNGVTAWINSALARNPAERTRAFSTPLTNITRVPSNPLDFCAGRIPTPRTDSAAASAHGRGHTPSRRVMHADNEVFDVLFQVVEHFDRAGDQNNQANGNVEPGVIGDPPQYASKFISHAGVSPIR
ncbi:MAG: protein kinase [Rhodospirillaceae bacterium]